MGEYNFHFIDNPINLYKIGDKFYIIIDNELYIKKGEFYTKLEKHDTEFVEVFYKTHKDNNDLKNVR